jgi:hypothetical protein
MSQVHEGGCLCRRVRYRTSIRPLRTLVCHCTFCQKMTGSASYAESMFPIDAVQFDGDTMHRYDHRSDGSGKHVHLHFCATCGTTVTLTFERWPQYRAISRGTFDDPNWVSVDANIWTRSAQSGVALPALVDCFDRGRVALDGAPEMAQRFDAPVMARGDREA